MRRQKKMKLEGLTREKEEVAREQKEVEMKLDKWDREKEERKKRKLDKWAKENKKSRDWDPLYHGDEWICNRLASEGKREDLILAHENGWPWDAGTCALAARGGHLLCLIDLHEHGCPWDEETCAWAAGGGHLGCLVFGMMELVAIQHGMDIQTAWSMPSNMVVQLGRKLESIWLGEVLILVLFVRSIMATKIGLNKFLIISY